MPRRFQQFVIQVGQSDRRLPAFPTSGHAVELESVDLAFAGLNRLVADTKWKAVAVHAYGNIFHWHVEDNQLMVTYCNNKALGLRRDQTVARRCQDCVHRVLRKIVAGNGEVFVFNAQDKDAALGVSESGYVFRDIIAHSAARARLLGAIRPLEQRFALEVLAFVLVKKGRDVETWRCHGNCSNLRDSNSPQC